MGVEAVQAVVQLLGMAKRSPFRCLRTRSDIIRLAVMMYVRFPVSLRNVEDLLHQREIDVSHETKRFWWHRSGRRSRLRSGNAASRGWVEPLAVAPGLGIVKINGERHDLWRVVGHESEVLESFVTKARDEKSELKFLKKSLKRHGRTEELFTDRLRSYGAALKELGIRDRQETGRWTNNRAENSHHPF